jgi:phosphopantothenoylcysteine decarboxylase/phosphopantothenate--cysteine ligase
VVGFAAETGDAEHSALELGRRKLAKYGVDLLVVNEVGVDAACSPRSP